MLAGVLGGFIFAPWLALCLMFYLPVMWIMIKIFGKKMFESTIAKMTQSAKLGSFAEEKLSAIKVVISFGQEIEAI